MIDLAQGLYVIGNESDGHDADLADAFRCQISDRPMQ